MNTLPIAGTREYVLWLFRRLRRFRITGDSMLPTLAPETEILADPRAYRAIPPCVGDIVVARHPYRTDMVIVKRVAAVHTDGSCTLTGDNPEASTDSRIFGDVPFDRILGRVSCQFG